ncbi:hypothetical protein WJ437_02690 [Ignavigranum ruoffiae]|uniref:hypothetical protein n=1 Tax=Ignavigranum ruoffiae TaxID=89093 RepID=UPI003B001578
MNNNKLYELDLGDIFYYYEDSKIKFIQVVLSEEKHVGLRQVGLNISGNLQKVKPLFNEFISGITKISRIEFESKQEENQLIYWDGDYLPLYEK